VSAARHCGDLSPGWRRTSELPLDTRLVAVSRAMAHGQTAGARRAFHSQPVTITSSVER